MLTTRCWQLISLSYVLLVVSIQGGLTPLHFAASNGQTATVVLLVKLGADKEARTDVSSRPFPFIESCIFCLL
jgi:hypothetical protein